MGALNFVRLNFVRPIQTVDRIQFVIGGGFLKILKTIFGRVNKIHSLEESNSRNCLLQNGSISNRGIFQSTTITKKMSKGSEPKPLENEFCPWLTRFIFVANKAQFGTKFIFEERTKFNWTKFWEPLYEHFSAYNAQHFSTTEENTHTHTNSHMQKRFIHRI